MGNEILVFLGLHSVAHVINGLNFSAHYNSLYKDINLASFEGEVKKINNFILLLFFNYQEIKGSLGVWMDNNGQTLR